VEVGSKLTFRDGKAFAGLSLYNLERNNLAIPDASGIARQNGDQRSRGIELDLSAEPARGWIAYATYAFTDATLTRFAEVVTFGGPEFMVVDHSGNRAPFAPKHLASLWTAKQIGGGFGLALGLRGVSEQFIAEDNRFRVGGYLTLDAAVSYQRGRSRVSVNFKNLTATEYETRGFGSTSVIPARPFEVLGRIEVGLGAR
jgi:outer membrane receptor protein involved in Fe transport